jgi:N-acylneuraminate cytidylyltransferase
MKKGKLTAVVAVRKGSQRVPNKNIRPFGDTTLLDLKLQTLLKVSNLDEIIVNSDCDEMLEIGKKYGVKTVKREPYFASSQASNSEFHGHIGKTTDTDFIFLAPVCSPFIGVKKHEDAINQFLNSDCDSLTSTHLVKGHLWLDGNPINYDLNNVPNSQDLPNIQMLNYGITIIDKKIMEKYSRVVGTNPIFTILNEYESVDVNTPLEWDIAELLYKTKKEELWQD